MIRKEELDVDIDALSEEELDVIAEAGEKADYDSQKLSFLTKGDLEILLEVEVVEIPIAGKEYNLWRLYKIQKPAEVYFILAYDEGDADYNFSKKFPSIQAVEDYLRMQWL